MTRSGRADTPASKVCPRGGFAVFNPRPMSGRRPARNRRTPQRLLRRRGRRIRVDNVRGVDWGRALVAQCTPPVRSHLRATGGCRGRPARSARSLRRTG
ncbi:hypothetical protein MYA_3799 [Burkholderia sp. KJ006]|nr:hypothetical protein MYA_3799 [Burkholderia sp. KJ006]